MSNHKRCGNKWTVNELLSLQREYELLEWNIQKIALKHSRSIESILYKLEEEGFISSWADARGFNPSQYKKHVNNVEHDEDEDEDYEDEDGDDEDGDDEDDDYEEEEEDEDDDYEEEDEDVDDEDDENQKNNEVEKLTERIWNLETSVSDISSMVKQMFDNLVSNKNTKNKANLIYKN
jgi:hypothetical protein